MHVLLASASHVGTYLLNPCVSPPAAPWLHYLPDPGYIPGTQLIRGMPRWRVRLMETMIPWVMWLSRSPQAPSTAPKSGAYQARLACDPAFAGKTGVYFEIDHEAPSSELSYDTAKAAEMWAYSEQVLKSAGVPLQL